MPDPGRQERYRAEYRRLRPGWSDSLVRYRSIVARHVRPACSVLDLGCGHADWLVSELAPARLTVGADADLDALRRGRAPHQRVAARAERLPFAAGSFDLVATAFLFEHLERPAEALAEIHRVLRPGGHLVFLAPNAWNYNVWLIRLVPNRLHDFFTRRLYARQDHDTYPVRYRLNSPRRLARALDAAGFRCRWLEFNGDPTYVSFNRPLFGLALAVERVLDLGPLRRARVHLLGGARR
jgi:SAM-dependent methyltransferase